MLMLCFHIEGSMTKIAICCLIFSPFDRMSKQNLDLIYFVYILMLWVTEKCHLTFLITLMKHT